MLTSITLNVTYSFSNKIENCSSKYVKNFCLFVTNFRYNVVSIISTMRPEKLKVLIIKK